MSRVFQGAAITADVDVTCDVCIVGTGAGGAVLAAGLAEKGLNVVMLEEGSYVTSAEFDLRETNMFPRLYQDRGTRATADLAIAILQGRAVGGTTVVNWTTCFRTPGRVLANWRDVHGLEGLDAGSLAPHFDAIEDRLSIRKWPLAMVNPNNQKLVAGCEKLGWHVEPLHRNVKGCVNSGYCGVGCVIDAKQSMLVTYVPDALAAGATLYADARAARVEVDGDRVKSVVAEVLDATTGRPTGKSITVRAKVTAVCGGAINSPALLLRSGLPEGGVGRRTFLHPVVAMSADWDERVEGWAGAPQSAASHEFTDRGPDKIGFFVECPPMQPMLASTAFVGFGTTKQDLLARLPFLSTLLALSIDGLMPGDDGGTVSLRPDGRVRVDYPISAALAESFHASHVAMAEILLAAGCTRVSSLHPNPVAIASPADVWRLDIARYGAHEHPIFTAHQMGGCAMGRDPATSVVDATMRHHRVKNLFVVDGSALPTALGVNPSETIYGLSHRARTFVGEAV